MSYQEFIKELSEELRKYLSVDTELRIQSVVKNNNIHLDGLTIFKSGNNVSPTFYLNYYYEEYKEKKSIHYIAALILKSYEEQPEVSNVDASFFTDFEMVKPNIAYKLINFSMNKELLLDIPHIPYLDLAIVFYCLINDNSFQNATILIRNQHLKGWNITDKQLYDIALQNTPRLLPHKLMYMRDLLDDSCNLDELNSILLEQLTETEYLSSTASRMYILSNERKIFGASSLLYLKLLEEIAERFQSSLYILPSSIHEVILIPCPDKSQLNFYTEMVREVNATHVLDEDILADHAYYYDNEKKAITYI